MKGTRPKVHGTKLNFLVGLVACALSLVLCALIVVRAQEQAPNRPEFTITARDFSFSPDHFEVTQDDLVKVTIRSEDLAYSFAIDEYRIVRRVPARGSTTFDFRADRVGTFRFYSNLTSEGGHASMQGQLVVKPR